MFGKHKKAKTPPPPASSGADPGVLISQGGEVRALLERGSTKSALELAKQIHKRCGTPALETLVVEAYEARIRSLLEHGLTAEAKVALQIDLHHRVLLLKKAGQRLGIIRVDAWNFYMRRRCACG